MLAVMLFMLPMAFMNGFVAFLMWVYMTLLAPHGYLYGFMIDFRYTFVFAVLSLGALVLGRVKDRGYFLVDKLMVLLLLFITHVLLSAVINMNSNPMVEYRLEYFIKGMALAVAAPFFINSRWRIHMVLIVLVAGLGFHGIQNGLKMISSGGTHIVSGIPRSTLADNNLFAVGMVMLLPLTLYLARYSASRLAKWAALGVFGLCVMAVLGSNSRGGFLALAILGVWYWITSPRKLISTLFVAIVAITVMQVAPDRWFDRMETIKNADQDMSFIGRVAAWKVSVNIANDNPVFGAGFDATQVKWIWDKYKQASNFIDVNIPEGIAYKAAHSNYFQVLGDLGYVGLLLFLALLAAAFVTRWQIKSLATKTPGDNAWSVDLATAINLSLVAFIAGGAGVSLAYFELAHLLIVILAIIRRLLIQQAALAPARNISIGEAVVHA